MSSYLITGSSENNRRESIIKLIEKTGLKFNSNNPDLLQISLENDEKSLGIAKIRELNKFCTQKPFSNSKKAVFVDSCHKLTHQAQNALLKTLEEHPEYVNIYLSSTNENDLLETVVSRCKRINLKTQNQALDSHFDQVTKMTVGERLSWAIDFAKNDSNQIENELEKWVVEARNARKYATAQRIINVSRDIQNTNINTKLALETLLINL